MSCFCLQVDIHSCLYTPLAELLWSERAPVPRQQATLTNRWQTHRQH